MWLVPEIADIVNSDQKQRKYESGAAKRKLSVEQKKTRCGTKEKDAMSAYMGLRQA